MQIRTGNLVAAALTATALSLHGATPTCVMLLDGANNHEWKTTSPVILKILDETGLFRTTRVTVDNADLATFKPDMVTQKVPDAFSRQADAVVYRADLLRLAPDAGKR